MELPETNQLLIWWWVSLCRVVAAYESSNSMGLKQLVVCWSPCLHKQDLSLASMQLITQANNVIQSVLLCVVQNHPPRPLCRSGPEQEREDWFPVTATEFFSQFLKARNDEDFFELEEAFRELLTCELMAQISLSLPCSRWSEACEGCFFCLFCFVFFFF